MATPIDTTPIARDPNGQPIQGTYRSTTSGVSGTVTSGTAIQLTTTSTVCKRVDVISAEGNTGTVYVGGSNVLASTNTGVPLLSPGSSATIPINDVSNVWFDSSQTGDKVSYNYYV